MPPKSFALVDAERIVHRFLGVVLNVRFNFITFFFTAELSYL